MGILGSQQAEDFASIDESRFDWRLVSVMLLIAFVGILNVYSVTSGTEHAALALRQGFNYLAGWAIIGVILFFDYRLIERAAYVFYGINILALSMVPLIGTLKMGARRWINLGFMSYQPSETMKIVSILALAKYFHSRSTNRAMDFKELIVPGLILGIPALLTMAQPDLGTGGHLAIIGTVMLLFVGIRTRVLLTFLTIGILAAPVAYIYGLKDYQRARIKTFLDPSQDPKGSGYNALQAMIAVGSGEIIGKGYQKGTQTQLEFTPEGHTDFIFTVLAEEWGLIGALFLLSLYVYMFQRCVTIATNAHDKFGSLVCVGVIGMLASQIFINVAMVCGMFPIVGIPLPYLSYGGTSVLTVSVALGLILNIGYRRTIF